MIRLRAFLHRHRLFLLLLLLFAVFRLLAILLVRPGGFFADFSDYDYYFAWGELIPQGYTPYVDLWATYPPLFPALMLPIFELAARIPPWNDPRLFFHALFGLTLVLFECGSFILIYRLAHKLAHDEPAPAGGDLPRTLVPPLLYALFFTPVYTLTGWFDAMPLFFLLLALDLLVSAGRGAWLASALAAALGFLTKLTPAIILPIAVRWLGAKLSWDAARREWFRPGPGSLLRPALYLLVFAVSAAGLGLWLARGNAALALSSFRINELRPPWQSVWALLDGYYGFGWVPLDMRNLPGLARGDLWQSRLPWPLITLAFGLLYLWLYTRRYDWARLRTAIAFTGASVIWLLLYAKGWSPQFLVYVLPFVALLPSAPRLAAAAGLMLLNFVEAYVFLILLHQEHWLLAATVITRTLLLVLLAADWLAEIWPPSAVAARSRRVTAAALWAVLLAAAIGGAAATPTAARAYFERRTAEHPCRTAIDFLAADTGGPARIVTDKLAAWHQFYPWLRSTHELHVVDSYSPLDAPPEEVVAAALEQFAGEGEFWWLEWEGMTPAAEPFFARPDIVRLDEQNHGPCTLARVLRLPGAAPPAQ